MLMSKQVQIVIDANVIIHFIKGKALDSLHKIFPQYKFVIIDELLNKELRNLNSTRVYLDNFLHYFPQSITVIKWSPNYEMIKELGILTNKYGYGESLCMVYCKYNNDVVASSDVKDITDYCDRNGIQYITTLDFLWQAYSTKIMTEKQCNDFINEVNKGIKSLNVSKITEYTPRQLFL